MHYWIDKEQEQDNVIVVSESSIYIGSCDKGVQEQVAQGLSEHKSPIDVLGSEDLTVIPFAQIQNMLSRNTDEFVEINFKAKKDIEQELPGFSTIEEKTEFIIAIEQFIPTVLKKSESQQSALIAGISPLFSLVLSLCSAYFFIDKFRWIAIIIGVLWTGLSIHRLISRVSQPPLITRWGLKGRYARKMWHGIKTGFAYTVMVLIIFSVYSKFPDSYGEASIYQQMNDESLQPSEVKTLVERGADIDFIGKDGESSLGLALYWGQDDIAISLIESGANLMPQEGTSPLESALHNEASVLVIASMLEHGASLEFMVDGQTPLEYYKDNQELTTLLQQHSL